MFPFIWNVRKDKTCAIREVRIVVTNRGHKEASKEWEKCQCLSLLGGHVVMCLYKTHAAIHWIVSILLPVSHIIYTDNENFLKTNLQIHWITVLEKYNPLKQIHEEGDLIGSIGIK